jgi:hypothetical protein
VERDLDHRWLEPGDLEPLDGPSSHRELFGGTLHLDVRSDL